MRIMEVSASVKLTKDYNSYQFGMTAEVEDDNPEIIGLQLLSKCIGVLQKKTGIKIDEAEIEKKVETKETDKPLWKKCPKCDKNCKIGFNKKNPDGYYCGDCKENF